jgi:hypothetical protein
VNEGFAGIEKLVADMKAEARNVNVKAAHHITVTAHEMAAHLRAAYPSKKGTLIAGVEVEEDSPLKVRVVSKDPEAVIWEVGAVARRTQAGANRGTLPPGNVFVPARTRYRKLLRSRFRKMLDDVMVKGMTRR